jgi:hypothetical protein
MRPCAAEEQEQRSDELNMSQIRASHVDRAEFVAFSRSGIGIVYRFAPGLGGP